MKNVQIYVLFNQHMKEDLFERKSFTGSMPVFTTNYKFKICGSPEAFTSTTIFKKCGAKLAWEAGTLYCESPLGVSSPTQKINKLCLK